MTMKNVRPLEEVIESTQTLKNLRKACCLIKYHSWVSR